MLLDFEICRDMDGWGKAGKLLLMLFIVISILIIFSNSLFGLKIVIFRFKI